MSWLVQLRVLNVALNIFMMPWKSLFDATNVIHTLLGKSTREITGTGQSEHPHSHEY